MGKGKGGKDIHKGVEGIPEIGLSGIPENLVDVAHFIFVGIKPVCLGI